MRFIEVVIMVAVLATLGYVASDCVPRISHALSTVATTLSRV